MSKLRLLIVDDEEIIVSVLHDYFSDSGAEVSSASSASEGLSILAKEKFDVVIVDMRLPDMSGNELLERAIAIDRDPVFFIHTGSIDYEIPQSLRDAGITDDNIIFKPIVDLNSLLKLIQNKTGWKAS